MFQLNFFAEQIIQTLLAHQIDYFCLAPGSRSTPFAQALSRQKKLTDFIHFDERSLAFHAIGYARGLKKPAPIFITSGSSLANLFPAVVEAYQDQIPLLIFSADRPVELRDCSSNQTIDQVKFFHKYALWQQDLPLYDESLPHSLIPSIIHEALNRSQKGPVHLNCQFREPFFEKAKAPYLPFKPKLKEALPLHLTSKTSKQLLNPPSFSQTQKGMILLGRKTTQEEFLAIHQLAQKLNWPIFPDVLAYGRWGHFSNVFPLHELLFELKLDLPFEICLHFGAPTQSKVLLKWIEKGFLKEYHQVHEEDKVIDPSRTPSIHHPLSPIDFCKQLHVNFSSNEKKERPLWQNIHEQIKLTLPKLLNDFTEQSLIHHLVKFYSKSRLFFVGASLPIRHLSSFSQSNSEHLVFSNRGASGIDGNLSTAFGVSQALDQPLTLLVGDLTFLYDLNALAQIRFLKHPIDLIVLNNSGGGIFSYLPIHEDQKAFKRYFQTPHSFELAQFAKPFGLTSHQPKTLKEFKELIQNSENKSRIIELQTCSEATREKKKAILKELHACFISEKRDLKQPL